MARNNFEKDLLKLYWPIRLSIAIIWIWAASTSWFFYPHSESIDWLIRLGLTSYTDFIFAAACLVDLLMGIAALFLASRLLWQLQFLLVVFYSLTVSIGLPEFLSHPFGPIIKDIAILACLAYLSVIEKYRKAKSFY